MSRVELLISETSWMWVSFGVLIFSGLTFLFPLIAALLHPLFFSNEKSKTKALLERNPHPAHAFDLEILIPAYNEADTIRDTVASVRSAVSALQSRYPHAKIGITIGLDGSTDTTPEIAKTFHGVRVVDRRQNRGKWKTIEELIMASDARWIALVDCGTLWSDELLIRCYPEFSNSRWVGIGPGYRQNLASRAERALWWLERTLKSIENRGGGTITLHGATIFFRTRVAQQVVREILFRPWLNDDVVLSIAMRTWGQTLYFGSRLSVGDIGVRAGRGEFNRRKRMILGNLEWIRDLFPSLWVDSPDVAILSLRRVFRVFWAWCLILSYVCFAFGLRLPLGIAVALPLPLLAVFLSNQRLREALFAALLTPLWLFKKTDVKWS